MLTNVLFFLTLSFCCVLYGAGNDEWRSESGVAPYSSQGASTNHSDSDEEDWTCSSFSGPPNGLCCQSPDIQPNTCYEVSCFQTVRNITEEDLDVVQTFLNENLSHEMMRNQVMVSLRRRCADVSTIWIPQIALDENGHILAIFNMGAQSLTAFDEQFRQSLEFYNQHIGAVFPIITAHVGKELRQALLSQCMSYVQELMEKQWSTVDEKRFPTDNMCVFHEVRGIYFWNFYELQSWTNVICRECASVCDVAVLVQSGGQQVAPNRIVKYYKPPIPVAVHAQSSEETTPLLPPQTIKKKPWWRCLFPWR